MDIINFLDYLVTHHYVIFHLFNFCLYLYFFWIANYTFLHDGDYNYCKERYILFDEFNHLIRFIPEDFVNYLLYKINLFSKGTEHWNKDFFKRWNIRQILIVSLGIPLMFSIPVILVYSFVIALTFQIHDRFLWLPTISLALTCYALPVVAILLKRLIWPIKNHPPKILKFAQCATKSA